MKKYLIFVIVAAIFVSVFAIGCLASESPYDPYIFGDVDGDEEVDVVDATFIQRYATHIRISISDEQLMHGDIDGDGDVSAVDATFIQRYATHIATAYPIGELVYPQQPTEEPTSAPTTAPTQKPTRDNDELPFVPIK